MFARRKYAGLEVSTAQGPTFLLDQDHPHDVTGLGADEAAAGFIEVWVAGGLFCLDAAEIGTLKFDSTEEVDRFLFDLLSRGWENLHADDYRIIP